MLRTKLPNKKSENHFFRLRPLVLTCVSFILLTSFAPNQVHAAVSSGTDYSIEVEDIGTSLPEPTMQPRMQQNTQLPLPVDIYTPPPYTISATNDVFSMKIPQNIIDFGALTATNPVTRTSDITMTTPLHGAQVVGYENRPFMNTEKTILPDTTCDTGTCTQTIPSAWENDLTYGFGFRCESVSKYVCGKDFTASSSFKQFADSSAKESPQTIMLNYQANQVVTSRITYKINISGTQPIGGYSNTVTYIAVPNF